MSKTVLIIDDEEQLRKLLSRIISLVLYQAYEKVQAQKKLAIKIGEKSSARFEDIIGKSTVIREAIQLARKIAPADSNVLLLGETVRVRKFLRMPFMQALRDGKRFHSHQLQSLYKRAARRNRNCF